jgi:hypothetical protein
MLFGEIIVVYIKNRETRKCTLWAKCSYLTVWQVVHLLPLCFIKPKHCGVLGRPFLLGFIRRELTRHVFTTAYGATGACLMQWPVCCIITQFLPALVSRH